MHQSHCPKWLLSFHFDLKALTPYRKYSEAIRSTGYKKTLRSPMERLFKIPLFKDRSLNTCTALFADKTLGKGGLTVLKGKVGAAKYTQSLRIHLAPISSSLCCDTHKKKRGESDSATLTCAFSKQWKVWSPTFTQLSMHDPNSSWV